MLVLSPVCIMFSVFACHSHLICFAALLLGSFVFLLILSFLCFYFFTFLPTDFADHFKFVFFFSHHYCCPWKPKHVSAPVRSCFCLLCCRYALHRSYFQKYIETSCSHIAAWLNVIHHDEHDGNRAWGTHAGFNWLFQNLVN